MRRGDRLFEIIEIIRSSRSPISAARIAQELGVVPRTVYRDVATLIAQGVPVKGEAGIGYILEPGFHIPPLKLTPDEIDAAVLGAQWVRSRGEPELARAADRLIPKIKAVSPMSTHDTFVAPPTSVAPISGPTDRIDAAEVRRAIHARLKIRITYQDERGRLSDRVIWPILIGYRDAGRIAAAWCEQRQAFRYFRLERISEAEVLADKIPRRMDILKSEWRQAMDIEREKFTRTDRP